VPHSLPLHGDGNSTAQQASSSSGQLDEIAASSRTGRYVANSVTHVGQRPWRRPTDRSQEADARRAFQPRPRRIAGYKHSGPFPCQAAEWYLCPPPRTAMCDSLNSFQVVFWLRLGLDRCHGAAGRCRRSDLTLGDPGWPELLRSDRIPSRSFREPFARSAQSPGQFGAVRDSCGAWICRICSRSVFGTKPVWCPDWVLGPPRPGSCARVVYQSRRARTSPGRTGAVEQVDATGKTRFSTAKYSFCRSNSWLTRPVTYVSNFNHLLSFMLRVHNTFHHRQFGFLGLTGTTCPHCGPLPAKTRNLDRNSFRCVARFLGPDNWFCCEMLTYTLRSSQTHCQ
jgi:hypothetical protein